MSNKEIEYMVILQNFQKQNKINDNIYNRNLANTELEPQLSFRPLSTKYQIMPILENLQKSNVEKKDYQVFSTDSVFFPGTSKPHFNGFAPIIDKESTLRNQFFALQKGDQHKYIPSSTSNLYNIDSFPDTLIGIDKNEFDNSILFRKEKFNNHNPNLSENIGKNYFYNSTRYQLNSV